MTEKHQEPLAHRITTLIRDVANPEGKVDYAVTGLADSVRAYVANLKRQDPADLKTRNERIAFWINAYNMISIDSVIKAINNDPDFIDKGNKGLMGRVKFFFSNKHEIGGHKYSLNQIETLLRLELQEPRVHFALVCGAASCPPLRNGLYSSDNLDQELDMAAKNFVNSDEGVKLAKEERIVELSMIFKWFKKDFGGSERETLKFIALYHSEQNFIETHLDELTVRYAKYNWGVNSPMS